MLTLAWISAVRLTFVVDVSRYSGMCFFIANISKMSDFLRTVPTFWP
jgi:hypothetical protein